MPFKSLSEENRRRHARVSGRLAIQRPDDKEVLVATQGADATRRVNAQEASGIEKKAGDLQHGVSGNRSGVNAGLTRDIGHAIQDQLQLALIAPS